jgi:ADP-ribose pyrophosphatase
MPRTKEIYAGRILTLNIEEHQLPDGRRISCEIVRHPGAVGVIPLLEDGRIVLIRQYRAAMNGMVIEIPAGKLDGGEIPEDCVHREIKEEIGYKVKSILKLGIMHNAVGFSDACLHLFAAEVTDPGEQSLEHDEYIQLLKLPFQDALAMIESGEITDAKTQLALLLYAREIETG